MKRKRHIEWTLFLLFAGICIGTSALNWEVGPKLPYPVINAAPVATKTRIYIIGGCSKGLDPENVIDTIISAPINLDGTFGPFTVLPTRLPQPRAATY